MNRSKLTSLTLALALCATAGLAGCWSPGGSRGWVKDSYTYESSSMVPQTVSVKDTRTGETLFSYDIPVGRQLVVRFFADHTPEDAAFPDLMKWDDWEIGTRFGSPSKELAVPPASGRMLEVSVRKSPEMPEAMRAGASASATPAAPGANAPVTPPAAPIAPAPANGVEPVY
ncbi:MAG: hypothetical protein K2X32_01610 [Phycisphaerales bacterium]|nr:hypothetical protein [Phycisphaerales bacterium]